MPADLVNSPSPDDFPVDKPLDASPCTGSPVSALHLAIGAPGEPGDLNPGPYFCLASASPIELSSPVLKSSVFRNFPEMSSFWLAVVCHFYKLLNRITGVISFIAYIFLFVISLVDLVTIKSEMVNPQLPF